MARTKLIVAKPEFVLSTLGMDALSYPRPAHSTECGNQRSWGTSPGVAV